jgi:hypothetical protein
MIKLILPFLMLTFTSSLALDPVQDFLSRNTSPIGNSKIDGQLFAGESWTGDNHQQPPGGYLIRFNAPMGLNGTPITFVSSSLFAYLRGSNWFAYETTNNGTILISDNVSFGHLNFYLAPANSEHGPVLCEITAGKREIYVAGVSLGASGNLVSVNLIGAPRDQDNEESDSDGKKTLDALIQQNHLTSFTPRLEMILLAEYLKTPSANWRPCKDRSMRGQQLDPDEKVHIAATHNFRRNDATQLRKSAMPAASQANK